MLLKLQRKHLSSLTGLLKALPSRLDVKQADAPYPYLKAEWVGFTNTFD